MVEEIGEEGEEDATEDDSTNGAVLVNGNDAEEEWGTNNEGTSSA